MEKDALSLEVLRLQGVELQMRAEMKALKELVHEKDERLESISKELGNLLLCPISFQPMREPMMGTDLRTYQKEAIEQSLAVKPVSPFTRGYMDKGSLRPNLLANEIFELMTKHFPAWEAAATIQQPPPAVPVKDALLSAIRRRNSDQAVELLGRDFEDGCLNGTYRGKEIHGNLLHLCISGNLPKVAIALVKRPDFRKTQSISSNGFLGIHLAAAFNFPDVCRAILKEMGPWALQARTLWADELVSPDGRRVVIPKDATAEDCARLFGHDPTWATI